MSAMINSCSAPAPLKLFCLKCFKGILSVQLVIVSSVIHYYTTSCRHASLHEKMFLKAVLAEFRRSGLEEANFKGVHQQLDAIYKTEGGHHVHY